jgi:sugar lactone lactonase YvrE
MEKVGIGKFIIICMMVVSIYACGNDDVSPENGNGELFVNISGLPSNDAGVKVTGPSGYSRILNVSDTLKELASGTYSIMTEVKIYRVIPISIGYRPEDLVQEVTINGDKKTVEVHFIIMPGSGKLWFGNQSSDPGKRIVAYSLEKISNPGDQNAITTLTGSVTSPRGLAFDPMGNLWSVDGAGSILMYSWNQLGSADVSASQNLSVNSPFSITFDQDSNLWCTNSTHLYRFSKNDLYSGSTPSPDITLSSTDFDGLKGLAFDQDGNLWVANSSGDNILKINNDKLTSSGEITPDISLICQSGPPVISTLSSPYSLAFDKNNNLLVGYFGPNVIVNLSSAERASSATITPVIQIKLDVLVLIDHMALDERGDLWLPLGEGKFGRINNSNLSSGGTISPDLTVTSSDMKYGSGMAIYAHPEGLPLR